MPQSNGNKTQGHTLGQKRKREHTGRERKKGGKDRKGRGGGSDLGVGVHGQVVTIEPQLAPPNIASHRTENAQNNLKDDHKANLEVQEVVIRAYKYGMKSGGNHCILCIANDGQLLRSSGQVFFHASCPLSAASVHSCNDNLQTEGL